MEWRWGIKGAGEFCLLKYLAMRKLCLYLVLVLAGSCDMACRKSSSTAANPRWTAGSDVYLVGADGAGQVVYWKNGQKTVVAPAGMGYGITVVGPDVYVGGVVFNTPGINTAAYWKNSTETDIGPATGISWGFQPVIQGSDVYVPGYFLDTTARGIFPVYWKNGRQIAVEAFPRGEATGIAVSDTDIYVIGNTFDFRSDTAHLWKNGVRVLDRNSSNGVRFSQILLSGGDVYVAGFQGYEIYGKQSVELPSAGGIRWMCISGRDVYATGWSLDSINHPHPAYWKNGVLVRLPVYPSLGYTQSFGIAVAGSDVYVAGAVDVNNGQTGVYWKNGVEDSLCSKCTITGIAVGN